MSAGALYNTALTPLTNDENALLASALSGNDTIILSWGNDVMSGFAGDDVIISGAGVDGLFGGGGNDTFWDTTADHNSDIINDFAMGDRIVFTDASIDTFTFSVLNNGSGGTLISYTGGSLTLSTTPIGRIAASAAPEGGVQLTVAHDNTPNDINGDGRSDIILRDSVSGWLTDWVGGPNGVLTNNGSNASIQFPSDWHVVGTGDFDGDFHKDLLLRSDANRGRGVSDRQFQS